MPRDKLQWHPAFQAALQIELEEEKPYLKIYPEYNLTKKPMQIDVLIHKAEEWQCKKKLARFFRGHNIIWLSRLRCNLTIEGDTDRLTRAYSGKEKNPLYDAVMEFIMRANQEQYKEAKNMCNAMRELFAEELEQARAQGLSEGLSQGLSQGLLQGSAGMIGCIRSMYGHRLTVESIAVLINQSKEYVFAIIDLITKYPAEDDVMIARRLIE